jgi:hypothetical protein
MFHIAMFSIFGCAALLASSSAFAQGLTPVPGSITYNGQPHTKLTRAPIGSTFSHSLTDAVTGQQYVEIYRMAPDRSLEIVSRRLYGPVSN